MLLPVLFWQIIELLPSAVLLIVHLPAELFTPLFAMARIVGWSAHRMEELINQDKIIRPAYKSVLKEGTYIELEER